MHPFKLCWLLPRISFLSVLSSPVAWTLSPAAQSEISYRPPRKCQSEHTGFKSCLLSFPGHRKAPEGFCRRIYLCTLDLRTKGKEERRQEDLIVHQQQRAPLERLSWVGVVLWQILNLYRKREIARVSEEKRRETERENLAECESC